MIMQPVHMTINSNCIMFRGNPNPNPKNEEPLNAILMSNACSKKASTSNKFCNKGNEKLNATIANQLQKLVNAKTPALQANGH